MPDAARACQCQADVSPRLSIDAVVRSVSHTLYRYTVASPPVMRACSNRPAQFMQADATGPIANRKILAAPARFGPLTDHPGGSWPNMNRAGVVPRGGTGDTGGEVVMTPRGHGIMAGYDGSAGSAEAVDWAVREARLRGVPLTVCHAWAPGYAAAGADAAHMAQPDEHAGAVDPAREHAEAVLVLGMRHARTCDSAAQPQPLLVCGPPARVLCEQCAGTGMLVVGARGIGGFAGLLLGSVGLQVASHAPVPVTVVRGSWQPVAGHYPAPVVVGTDGSPKSQAALDFAAEEAALRDAPLVAVCALSDAAGVLGTARMIEADFSTAVSKLKADHPDVLVQKRVEQGAPRAALLGVASRGQLLVVGARGRGGLNEMTLGSVTFAVLHHAPCPVTVVRGVVSGTQSGAGQGRKGRQTCC